MRRLGRGGGRPLASDLRQFARVQLGTAAVLTDVGVDAADALLGQRCRAARAVGTQFMVVCVQACNVAKVDHAQGLAAGRLMG